MAAPLFNRERPPSMARPSQGLVIPVTAAETGADHRPRPFRALESGERTEPSGPVSRLGLRGPDHRPRAGRVTRLRRTSNGRSVQASDAGGEIRSPMTPTAGLRPS